MSSRDSKFTSILIHSVKAGELVNLFGVLWWKSEQVEHNFQ